MRGPLFPCQISTGSRRKHLQNPRLVTPLGPPAIWPVLQLVSTGSADRMSLLAVLGNDSNDPKTENNAGQYWLIKEINVHFI